MQDPMIMAGIIAFFFMSLAYAGMVLYRDYTGTRTLDKRLDRLAGKKVQTLQDSGILKDLDAENRKTFIEEWIPQLPNLHRYLEQADVDWKPSTVVTASLISAAIGIWPILIGMPVMVCAISVMIFAMGPWYYIYYKRSSRLKKFEGQLGEALELVARALRAGHALASGMHAVSTEMPDPVAKEFGRVYEEQNLGISLEDAMRNLANRIPNLDLKFFVTAVIIQRQTGGDLAEILDKIGHLIRERFKLLGLVQALTGEGRISGIVLIALPFGLLFLMMAINYPYVSLLWTEPMGRMMSICSLIAMAIGAWWIRKIVNIKI